MSVPGDIKALLKQYPSLTINDRGKIHCDLTGHDMPLKAEVILAYVNGTAYNLAEQRNNVDVDSLAPWIIPHKSNPKKLFCTLTRIELNKIHDQIQGHMQGRKFLRLKKEFEEREAKKAAKEAERAARAASKDSGELDFEDFESGSDEDSFVEEDEKEEDDDDDTNRKPVSYTGIYIPSDDELSIEGSDIDSDDNSDDTEASEEEEKPKPKPKSVSFKSTANVSGKKRPAEKGNKNSHGKNPNRK